METIDEGHKANVQKNRSYIKLLADILCLTAKQNIAQHSHGKNDDTVNSGNFIEILELMSRYNPKVIESFNPGPQSEKYTHHSIQNALIEIIAELVFDKIKEEI